MLYALVDLFVAGEITRDHPPACHPHLHLHPPFAPALQTCPRAAGVSTVSTTLEWRLLLDGGWGLAASLIPYPSVPEPTPLPP